MLYTGTGAATLGALHAFEPGHGKTLIAAYLIGTRGRAWDGFLLGVIVTFTHTFSVILLGIVAKLLSQNYSETELHNWLGLAPAAIIIFVDLWMLKQRLGSSSPHGHFISFPANTAIVTLTIIMTMMNRIHLRITDMNMSL